MAKKAKTRTPKDLEVVVVRWLDAATDVDIMGLAEEILEQKIKRCERYTIGYLIGYTKDNIVLASDFDNFIKEEGNFQNVTQIPREMVIKVYPCSFTLKSTRPRSKLSSGLPPASLPSTVPLITVGEADKIGVEAMTNYRKLYGLVD